MINREVFITCAVTGARENVRKSPNVPITPKQIADDVVASAKAGAAICHVHVRDPETGVGSRDTELYREVMSRIRDSGVDVIINLTAGMGGDLEFGTGSDPLQFGPGTDCVSQLERLAHVEALLPEICTLDCGTYNSTRGSSIYVSNSQMIREGALRIRELGVKPELEVFDMGHLWFANELIEEGVFDGSVMLQLCMGVPYAAPATTEAFAAMRAMLPKNNVIWSGFGVGAMQLPMVAMAVVDGGNVRVGLEDNIYLKRGVLATNQSLVERAAVIVEALGSRILTPAETRAKIGLKTPA